MDSTNDTPDAPEFFGCDFRSFVQEDDVAEFNLLDDQVLDVILIQILTQEVVAVTKFIAHAQGINHRGNTIHNGHAVVHIFQPHSRYGADGLRNGSRLTDTAGLNDDVVETLLASDVAQLFHEVHLQRTADATIL